jgi:hypothetical protein
VVKNIQKWKLDSGLGLIPIVLNVIFKIFEKLFPASDTAVTFLSYSVNQSDMNIAFLNLKYYFRRHFLLNHVCLGFRVIFFYIDMKLWKYEISVTFPFMKQNFLYVVVISLGKSLLDNKSCIKQNLRWL